MDGVRFGGFVGGGLVFFGFSAGFLFGLLRVCLSRFLDCGFWLGWREGLLVGFLLEFVGLCLL